MFKNVLVGLDGSERSERSLPWVRLLAREHKTTLVRALEPVYGIEAFPADYFGEAEERAQKYLAKTAREFAPEAQTFVKIGSPAAMILNVAEETGADLIAITTHGGSPVERRVFGRTTEKLLHGSEIPLLVVPSWTEKAPQAKLGRIIVPLDGSNVSEMVLPFARRLAQVHDAALVLVHALTDREEANRNYAEIDGHFAKLASGLDKNWVQAKVLIKRGEAEQQIVEAAESEGADLIVMSAHGYGALKRMLFGSVASKVIRTSPVPVLVARYDAMKKLQKAEPQAVAK